MKMSQPRNTDAPSSSTRRRHFVASMFTRLIIHHTGILLFALSALVGIHVFDDYGISWDEEQSRNNGIVNYEYLFSGSKELLTYRDRDYGIAVELTLVLAEKLLKLSAVRHVYLLRHLLTHLFFLFSAYCCFKLVSRTYRSKILATIGFLMIVLCPHLYAHSFFNSKDVPFASMLLVCFYLMANAFTRFTLPHFLLLGAGMGILINIRVVGVILFGCIVLLFAFHYVFSKDNTKPLSRTLHSLMWFLLATMLTLYASWPYLWADPFGNFMLVLGNMSRFRWHGYFLFNGEFVGARNLPWYYIPVCFSLTTPLGYLIAGAGGLIFSIVSFLRRPSSYLANADGRYSILYMICFLAPVLAVIFFHSVVYDSWRHLYFIYPAFVMIAIGALNRLMQTRLRIPTLVSVFLYFSYVAIGMVRSHPHEHVYFNELTDRKTPEHLRSQYELDYWGASYKQALEHILRADNSSTIVVCAGYPAPMNAKLLPPESRQRLTVVPFEQIDKAKYFVTNYRYHPQDYPAPLWHAIKVGNNTVSGIYRLK